jgi:hypothetical protein
MIEDDEDDSWLDAETTDEAHDWLSLQQPPEGDFLGAVAPANQTATRETFLDVLSDDTTPRELRPDIPAGVDGKLVPAILAAKRLHPRQRTFIRALVQEGGNVQRARKTMNARTPVPLEPRDVHRWMRDQEFMSCYKAAAEAYLAMSGIDPQGVLLKLANVIDSAMTPAPILHQGRHTGHYEVDRSNALAGIEKLGKYNKMWGGDEAAARVTVQIIDLSGDKEVVVEPIEHVSE